MDPTPTSRASSRAAGFLDPGVLERLRCPVTRQPLEARLIDGRPTLCTSDGRHVYAIRDGIPILLPPTPAHAPTAQPPNQSPPQQDRP